MESNPSLICNDILLNHIQSNLKKFTVKHMADPGNIKAAVAVTVVNVAGDTGVYHSISSENSDSAALILTRRASKLPDHAGQWAFPGGQMDKGETPEETALTGRRLRRFPIPAGSPWSTFTVAPKVKPVSSG